MTEEELTDLTSRLNLTFRLKELCCSVDSYSIEGPAKRLRFENLGRFVRQNFHEILEALETYEETTQ